MLTNGSRVVDVIASIVTIVVGVLAITISYEEIKEFWHNRAHNVDQEEHSRRLDQAFIRHLHKLKGQK